ncbi:MAG: hypothetical protein ACRELG_01185 [Gemmataceae bacterium]
MASTSRGEWFDDFLAGLTAYYLTSLPVLLGVLFGVDFPRPGEGRSAPHPDLASACVHFDAGHYVQITREGYNYDPAKRSLVAFFPVYPLLSRGVSQATGLSTEEALLLTSHAALLGAFVLLVRYVRVRWPEATAEQRSVVLAVFGLWPLGLFFRMPYAESLFVCVTLALLNGMARGWPLLVLALLAGLGTAVRPVGVALTAAFVWHVLVQPNSPPWAKLRRLLLMTPLACWGLLAYMTYQWLAFGTPLAFAQTQEHWSWRAPADRGWLPKLESLATLEPIWGVYAPGGWRYWLNVSAEGSPLYGLYFWNPIVFVLAGALLVLGGWKRWLNGSELVLGACLLAIPYLTRSYEMSMGSHGRFAAVVVVNYLVIGRKMRRSSAMSVAGVCAVLALFIFVFTFLYVKNFPIF